VDRRVSFTCPYLPPFLEDVRIAGLRVGQGTVDLLLARHEQDVGINVLRRKGSVEVVVVK
jgi:hypothetical protein